LGELNRGLRGYYGYFYFNVGSGDVNQDQKENKRDDTEVIPPQRGRLAYDL